MLPQFFQSLEDRTVPVHVRGFGANQEDPNYNTSRVQAIVLNAQPPKPYSGGGQNNKYNKWKLYLVVSNDKCHPVHPKFYEPDEEEPDGLLELKVGIKGKIRVDDSTMTTGTVTFHNGHVVRPLFKDVLKCLHHEDFKVTLQTVEQEAAPHWIVAILKEFYHRNWITRKEFHRVAEDLLCIWDDGAEVGTW